jgi:hypothetical protein
MDKCEAEASSTKYLYGTETDKNRLLKCGN